MSGNPGSRNLTSWRLGLLGLAVWLLLGAGGSSLTIPDLDQVAQELEQNLKELRRNITAWQQLRHDPQLSAAAKATWREQAQEYLRACQHYLAALAELPPEKLRRSPAGQKILTLKGTFQQETQFLETILAQP